MGFNFFGFLVFAIIVGCAPRNLATHSKEASVTAPQGASIKIVPGEDYLATLMPMLKSAKSDIDVLQFNYFSESGPTNDTLDEVIQIHSSTPQIKIRVL